MKLIKTWFSRYFSDPELILLLVILLFIFGVIFILGDVLAPLFASIVIAYFLQWWVKLLQQKLSHTKSYAIVYIAFMTLFGLVIFFVLPLLWRQIINLLNDLPTMIQNTRKFLQGLLDNYPHYISEQQVDIVLSGLLTDVQVWGKQLLSISLSSIPGVIGWIIYLILVPLLVFFFLKDRELITNWLVSFLPKKRRLAKKVWLEMDRQIGNYVRGKIIEIVILGFVTYLLFLYFGLKYSVLLASLVGFSALIPYIGAVIVTIPVVVVGFLQWGFSPDFTYMLVAYFVIQALDGNLLVPFLFSEAVNLHPVAIIIAVLFFGTIWGFWGLFFAIPLATLIKAVLKSWPVAKL